MKTSRSILRSAALAAVFVIAACNLFEGGTRVRDGQLFQPGVANYDHYFKEVHELQTAQGIWGEDKKASRRALVDYLKLSLDAADVTIAQATHERMVGAAHQFGTIRLEIKADEPRIVVAGGDARVDATTRDLFRAIEGTIKAELTRRKTLTDIPGRIDELTKAGRDLEPHVREDFAKNGGSLASDVKDELTASYDVLSAISGKARTEGRESEDFVSVLERAVASEPTEPLPQVAPPPSSGKTPPPPLTGKPKPTGTPPPPSTKPASTTPPPPSTAKPPPPKPPPTSTGGGGGDEVFNP
ncbi:hypothetical protein BH09MYX1_BH09MYX1_62220 [soil metagenome]